MNCLKHPQVAGVGLCAVCQRGVCADCVAHERPRVVCRDCALGSTTLGFEYKSGLRFGRWPLIHIVLGMDAVTMRPKVAKGVIAIGNIAMGGVAIGGIALGLVSL